MNLLKKVEKFYSQELKDYTEKYPTSGMMLIDHLEENNYVGDLKISRVLDLCMVIDKTIGDTITELYRISCETN